MIQIDGPRRRVYIKLNNEVRLQAVLHMTQGQLDYIHEKGELSIVYIEQVRGCGASEWPTSHLSYRTGNYAMSYLDMVK
jgi:hypothetical protein